MLKWQADGACRPLDALRSMVMHWIIREWITQWLGMRDRLRSDATHPDHWWMHIRERILRFMVSRYIDEPSRERAMPRPEDAAEPPPLPADARRVFCRAETSSAYAPRKCVEMQSKLRSLRRVNEYKRPRWRWW